MKWLSKNHGINYLSLTFIPAIDYGQEHLVAGKCKDDDGDDDELELGDS